MPRETIKDLRAEVEKRDQEIGHLRSLLDEAKQRNYETRQALRLVKTIVEDAQK
jgi:hypothetical protein